MDPTIRLLARLEYHNMCEAATAAGTSQLHDPAARAGRLRNATAAMIGRLAQTRAWLIATRGTFEQRVGVRAADPPTV